MWPYTTQLNYSLSRRRFFISILLRSRHFESEAFLNQRHFLIIRIPSQFLVPKHFPIRGIFESKVFLIQGIFESEVFLNLSNFESKFFITAQEMPCQRKISISCYFNIQFTLEASKIIFRKQNIITNPAGTGSVVLLI